MLGECHKVFRSSCIPMAHSPSRYITNISERVKSRRSSLESVLCDVVEKPQTICEALQAHVGCLCLCLEAAGDSFWLLVPGESTRTGMLPAGNQRRCEDGRGGS